MTSTFDSWADAQRRSLRSLDVTDPADAAELDTRVEQALIAIHEAAVARVNLMPPAGLRLSCWHCQGSICGPLAAVADWLPGWLEDHKHPEKSEQIPR